MMFVAWAIFLFVIFGLCEGKPASTCRETEFPCKEGSCIDKSKWCDTEVDCYDQSDEMYCYTSSNLRPNPNKCDGTFFKCKDGPCIPIVGRCDGYSSCHDNSDEENCGTTDSANGAEISSVPVVTTPINDKLNGTEIFEMTTPIRNHELNTTEVLNTTELPVTTSTFHILLSSEALYDNESVLQADSVGGKKLTVRQDKDFEKGFIKLVSRDFRRERTNARQWLLKVRDHDYGWGDETARAITAFYMSDDDTLKQDDGKMLMLKQLHLKLFTALIRNQTSQIPLGDLALFMNALAASCDNPRNFYGQDLVDILRQRTNLAQGASTFVTPLVYLTLCLNDVTSYADVLKIQEIQSTPKVDKIDIGALVSLAATCISRIQRFSSYPVGKQAATRLYHKISRQGLPENIYELALVAQALNEARINQDLWNRSEAMDLIKLSQKADGSFGDILSTYYVVPILSGGSLISLSQHCNPDKDKDLTPLEVLKNGKDDEMYIHYSLRFGEPVEVSQSLMMKVKSTTNFMDVMRIAENINPVYKFRYDLSRGKPTVYSIGGVVNDAERGLYWTLHVSSQKNSTDAQKLQPYEGDIRTFVPKVGDYVTFWIKSVY